MRILGIDPGTATTGFGVIETHASEDKLVTAGVIRTPAKQTLERRLKTIYDELTHLIHEQKPKQMAVELLYFASNVTTAMSVSHARGVVLLAAAEAKLPVVEYTPLQVKQALTSYGRASKQQMQQMVKKLLRLKAVPKPDDAADALAVAICHGATIRS
ncbi:crossover junction endodeoxyribonuclease RuvC [Candidatus Microgenomates bacterium]|nr:crossover junction endodeoxyribonuclease RuvC [Candidatus Microgenomates bacterium]